MALREAGVVVAGMPAAALAVLEEEGPVWTVVAARLLEGERT
jgi:hypothetical protein